MKKTSELLVTALKSKYKASMDDAIARMSVYMTNAVGIGEHPQITEEMDKLVEQYTTSNDKLEGLSKMVEFLSHK